jgi:hypothetical protein
MRSILLPLSFAVAASCPAQDLSGLIPALANHHAFKITAYRADLQIQNASGMLIPPEMGLSSNLAFTGAEAECVVTGELCLVKAEIDPVIDDLRSGGIVLLSLGSRMAGEQPSVYFLQFTGKDRADMLAQTLRRALDELGKDRLISEGLNRTGHFPIVDWKLVSTALGRPVTQIGSSRIMRVEDGNSWATFGGCTCGRTILVGCLRLSAQDLQRTIDNLRKSSISITAISNQYGSTTVCFEAEGEAVQLAAGLRRAWPMG